MPTAATLAMRVRPRSTKPAPGLNALVANLRILMAEAGALQPPEALCAFELAAMGRYLRPSLGDAAGALQLRACEAKLDLSAMGAELAARHATLIRQTKPLN